MYSTKIQESPNKTGGSAVNYCTTNGILGWYVLSSNTSWSDVEEAVIAGPFIEKEKAEQACVDTSCWIELLSIDEAKAKTY